MNNEKNHQAAAQWHREEVLKVTGSLHLNVQNLLLKQTVCVFGASYLPRLRRLPREQVQAIADEASAQTLLSPVWTVHEPRYTVSSYGHTHQQFTGVQVIALLVFSLWVLCGEDEKLAAPLVAAWPIKLAVLLASHEQH
jgi:hypothetical protein